MLPRTTRIALVDDHNLVRQGFESLLSGTTGYQVVVSAASGAELLSALERTQVDIAMVDLQMPGMDGHELIQRLGAEWPQLRCLVVTFDATDEALAQAIRCGARGFILKTINAPELGMALNAIRDIGWYHNEWLEHHLQDHADGLSTAERERRDVLARLTPRQIEYLRWLADERELTNKWIAALMNVEDGVVEACQEALRRKFGIHSKTGALLFAIKWGIVKVRGNAGGRGAMVEFPITPPNFRSKEIPNPEALALAG